MSRNTRNTIIIVGGAAAIWFLPVSLVVRVNLSIAGCFCVICYPMFALMGSYLFSVSITRAEVITIFEWTDQWFSVPEVKRRLEDRKKLKMPKHVALDEVMSYVYTLSNEGILDGRERSPRQSAFFSEGYIWEYRRKR